MRVVVVGADGQLGSDVVNAFNENGDVPFPLTHSDVELTDAESVMTTIDALRPDVIVNTAAMHHVEKCEADPERSFAVNAMGARHLAFAANRSSAALIHISTDYVFDGGKQSPYVEQDFPRPLNVYGNSKLAGEFFVRSIAAKHFVLRTSAIYGARPCRAKGGLNFVELMLKLATERGRVRVVDNEYVSPTPTKDIAKQLVILSRSNAYDLYHGSAEGSCSWFAFAREIFDVTGTKAILELAGPNEFPAKVPRPLFSVLENQELKRKNLNVFRPWQVGLREYLAGRTVPGDR